MTRYVIVGAGAIGVTLAAELAAVGRDVVLVGRGRQLALMRSGGVRYVRPDGERVVDVPTAGGAGEVDLTGDDVLVLATKTQAAEAVLAEWAWRPVVDSARPAAEVVPVVTLQNGLDAERTALRRFATVLGGVVWAPSSYVADGEVVSPAAPAPAVVWVGAHPDGPAPAIAARIARDLRAAQLEVQVVDDLSRWKAAKLVTNATFVLDALYSPGQVRDGAASLVRGEARAALTAAGYGIADVRAESTVALDRFAVQPIAGHERGGSSTWQSVARGRDVETDFLTGEVVLLARLHGVPAPVSTALLARVRSALVGGEAAGSLPERDLRDLLAAAGA